jgi:carboxymethylenebutenolidase
MYRAGLVAFCALFVSAPVLAQSGPALDPHATHAMEQQAPSTTAASQPRNDKLPPDADAAAAQLKSSPRHSEWVDVKNADGTPIKSFVVYPERKDKAPVVIVIHEIFGLSDWVRGVADQLAKEGFIAIAPDFLSG